MTVSTDIIESAEFLGNGTTTELPFNFWYDDESHVKVFEKNADGTFTEITRDYVVERDSANSESGKVILANPLINGVTVKVVRDTLKRQFQDYPQNSPFYPENHERGYDKLTAMIQEICRRTFAAPIGSNVNTTFPVPYLPGQIITTDGNKLLWGELVGNPDDLTNVQIMNAYRSNANAIGAIDFADKADAVANFNPATMKTARILSKDGGLFKVVTSSPFSDTGNQYAGMFIAAHNLERIPIETVNPCMFGAQGNGADDTAALQATNDFHMNQDVIDEVTYAGDWSISTGLMIGVPVASTASARKQDKSIVGAAPLLRAIDGNQMDYMVKVEGTDRLIINGVWRLLGGSIVGGNSVLNWDDRTCTDGFIFGTNTEFRIDGIHADTFKNYGVASGDPITPHISNNNAKLGVIRGFRCGSGAGMHLPTPVPTQALQANYSNVVSTTTANSFGQKTVMNVSALPPEFVEGYHETQVNVHIDDDIYQVESIDRGAGTITIYPFLNPASTVTGSLYYQFGGAVGLAGNDTNMIDIDTIATITCSAALWVASLYGASVRQIISQFDCSALVIGKNKQSAHIGGNYNVYVEGEKHWLIRRTVTGDNVTINPIVIDNFKNASQCYIPRGTLGSDGFYGAYGIFDKWNINYDGNQLKNDKRLPSVQEVSQFYNIDLTSPSPYLYRANSATGIKLLRGLDTVNSGNFSQQITFIGRTTLGAPTGVFTFESDLGDTIAGAGTITGNKIAYDGFNGPVTFNIQYNQATKVWYVYPDMAWTGY